MAQSLLRSISLANIDENELIDFQTSSQIAKASNMKFTTFCLELRKTYNCLTSGSNLKVLTICCKRWILAQAQCADLSFQTAFGTSGGSRHVTTRIHESVGWILPCGRFFLPLRQVCLLHVRLHADNRNAAPLLSRTLPRAISSHYLMLIAQC